jgi:uncharacterized protein (DUF1501 family)
MNRRHFIKTTLAAGTAVWLPSRIWADEAPAANRLVVVMLRGAVDGLSIVVPYSDAPYYAMRSSIAIAKPGDADGALDLDGRFGLHPALASVLPLWQAGQLAFVPACGSPDPTRSHFDAQDYLETGTPGNKRTADGWMNRLFAQLPPAGPASFEAVSLSAVLPRIFSGDKAVANVPLGRDAGKPMAMDKPEINAAFDRMYADAGTLGAAYREGRTSREHVLADLNSDPVSPEAAVADRGAPPPDGFALDAHQLATLVRRNPGMRLAFAQLGGWDTHVNQGGAKGQLANRLKPLGDGLATLARELGPEWDHTVVVVMSEFGRTARQNGTGGTDHGHGNVLWVLGGRVNGGRFYGDWPGLEETQLHESRDLAITVDFRSVLSAVCRQHLKLPAPALAAVFPDAPKPGPALDQLLQS